MAATERRVLGSMPVHTEDARKVSERIVEPIFGRYIAFDDRALSPEITERTNCRHA